MKNNLTKEDLIAILVHLEGLRDYETEECKDKSLLRLIKKINKNLTTRL